MQTTKLFLTQIFALAILVSGFMMAGAYFIPWQTISWGSVAVSPAPMITVTGTAQTQQKTQVATFVAGVTSVNDNKDTAVNEVNDKVTTIIESVKEFGIEAKDIQTQNLNVYQMEESYYDEGRQKTRQGQWRVSNDVSIKLRDVDRASELAGILTKGGATNVYGPNFALDDTKEAEADLLQQAIEDARKKAEIMAAGSGRTLGKVISVTEGGGSGPIVPMFAREMGGGGGAPTEPGSGTVSSSVTVTFELR